MKAKVKEEIDSLCIFKDWEKQWLKERVDEK